MYVSTQYASALVASFFGAPARMRLFVNSKRFAAPRLWIACGNASWIVSVSGFVSSRAATTALLAAATARQRARPLCELTSAPAERRSFSDEMEKSSAGVSVAEATS